LRWGSLEQALDHNKQAAAHFRKVIALNEHIQMRDLTADAELNLAYSLAQWGNLDEAERQLEHVTMYLVDDPGDSQRLQIAARIAYRRGDRTQAWSLNQKAWPHVTDIDQQIHVANMQAEIALANGDFEQAEIWADRGAKQVETIAMGQSAIELRAWAMSSRRAPYELLFIAQARRHRVEDAVMTIARWQGRALLDALARSNHRAPADLRAVATELSNLGEWLPAVSAAPIATLPSLPALLDTLQSIDLLALVVADGDVWRVAANHGSLALDRLGPVSVLKSKIIAFCAHPTDPRLAEDLGELLLPDELFRATREPLHVLLDEQLGSLPRLDAHLGSLPVAALRRHGAPLITSRPVVRILRLPEGPCVQAVRSGRATVLADAAGNLPKARQEGDEVAAHLHTTAAVGRAVTSKLLLDAERDAVLHIAGHTTPGSAADTLELDREVSALEISARSQGPSLVFLSACESGSSESSARGGSLAAAFLAAGSQQVVATLRRVSDQSALDLSMQFYRAGGVQNPVQALALVQASLSKTADNEWPLYAVFGYNVCTN
jgi:tetratricopeptide (TPR) repeat protein